MFPVKPTLKPAKQVQKYTKYTHSTFMVGLSAFNHLWGKCEEKNRRNFRRKMAIEHFKYCIFSVLRNMHLQNKSELCVTVIDDSKLHKMKCVQTKIIVTERGRKVFSLQINI